LTRTGFRNFAQVYKVCVTVSTQPSSLSMRHILTLYKENKTFGPPFI